MREPAAGLVGRGRELAALDALAAAAGSGRFQLALVEGEAGIGKTSLLSVVAARARERGAAVGEGAGAELEIGSAFAPLLEAFRALPGTPARAREIRELLLRAEPDADPAAVRFRVVEQFVELIEAVVLERPLVLCLDDAQWADDGTMAVLSRLARRFAFAPLAVVIARRTLPPSPHVDALVARLTPAELLEIRLEPLGDPEVREVATEALAARPGPRLESRLRRAGGNPLLVVELLAALARDETIRFEHGMAETSADELPVSLSAVVRRRVSRLPADALELLRVAAVLGPSFPLAHLRAAAGQPPSRLAPALAAALEEGVLEERDGEVGFRHHLIRDVIHDELPEAVRRTLHLGAADALGSLAAPAAEVAAHLEAAAELGETRAMGWLRRAARESASPATALHYLERALTLSAASPGERDEVLAERAQALLWAGRPAESEAAARDLLPRVRDPSLAALLLRVLFRALLVQGRAADLMQLAEMHLARLPERDLGLLLAEMAYLLTETRQQPPAGTPSGPAPHGTSNGLRAAELGERALAIGRRLGDASTVCLSLCALSSLLDTQGRFAEAAELSRQAVTVADDAADDAAQRHAPHFHLALQLVLGDRLTEAKDVIVGGLARAEGAGVVWVLPLHHYLLGRVHFGIGSWDEAVADWETALALGDEVGTQMIVADAAQAFLAQVALHRGDLRAAEARVAAAADAARTQAPGEGVSPFALWARALVAEARGRLDDAARAATELHRFAVVRRWLAVYRLVGVDGARITAAAGQLDTAREIAAAVEELAVRSRSQATGGAARLARGHAEGDVEILLESVDGYRGTEVTFERASALETAGAALLGTDEGRAAELLSEALTLYERIGASRLSARVDGLLRGIGAAPRRRGRPRRGSVGWESLTDAERRVAALVASGLSNAQVAERLVISPRTVQTHVAHIFTKLGMTNRAQLAAEAAVRRP